MAKRSPSQASTPVDTEADTTYQLTLVTLAGDEIQLPIELQEFDRLDEFENSVAEYLPKVRQIATFGCELDFVHPNTLAVLCDPVWDTLHECNRFTLVVRKCLVSVEHKGQIRQRYPRAIRIPVDDTGFALDNATQFRICDMSW